MSTITEARCRMTLEDGTSDPTNGSREWPRVKLGELCHLVNGDAYRESDWSTAGVPIIRIQNLNNHAKSFNYWAGSLDGRVVVNDGDVLLAWSGTPGTSFGTHIWNRGLGILNQHIFRVDLDRSRIDPHWAVFAINEQLDEMIGRAHGAVGLRHVTRGEVESLSILMPPLAEQRRIAGRLREQLAEVAKARTAVQAQLAAAQALPAAALREVFDSDQGWESKRLGEVLSDIQAGKCLNCVERPATASEWGVLKVSAVTWGSFRPEANKVVPPDFVVPLEYEVKSGDLLISRSNTTELVGAVVLVKSTRPKLMLSDKTLRLVPRVELATVEFLDLCLRSTRARQFIEGNSTGASSSMKNITQDTIRNIPIVLPPLDEQRTVAARLASELAEATQLRKSLTEKLEAIDRLPAALLAQAFQGAGERM